MKDPVLDPHSPASQRNRWLSAIVLTVASLAAFCPILGNGFVEWDDPTTIYQNPLLNPPSWHGVMYYFQHGDPGLFAPFTYAFWSLLALIGHLKSPGSEGEQINPFVFHLASLLLHIGCVMLVLSILRRIGFSLLNATIGAGLFAVHPLQAETVAWATAGKDLLSTLFSFAAIDQFLAYRERNARGHYFAAWIALLFSLLCKPAAVITPIILIVLDRSIAKRNWRQITQSLWPFVFTVVPFVIAAKIMQTISAVTPTPIWSRPLVAGDALAFYLGKLVWPTNLTMDYGRTPELMLRTDWIYFAWILPALLALILWTRRRKAQIAVIGAVIFLIALLPVLGLSPFMFQAHSTTADHYTYFPMLGVAIVFAWMMQRFKAMRPIAITLLIGYSLLSNLQSRIWKGNLTLFHQAIESVPQNAPEQANYGNALARAGQLDLAIPHFVQAVQIDPKNRLAHLCLAEGMLEQGRFEDAISEAGISISLVRGGEEPGKEHLIIGLSLMKLNRIAEAADQFRQTLITEPDNQFAKQQLNVALQQAGGP